MKKLCISFLLALTHATTVAASPHCQTSHSWQCQQHHGGSGQATPTGTNTASGMTPDPSKTNPQLGTVTTQGPSVGIQPVNPHPISTNTKIPPKKPILTPPLAPQAVPQAIPQAVPQKTPSVVNTPNLVPIAVPHATPQAIPYLTPSTVATPGRVPVAVPMPNPSAIPYKVPPFVNVPNKAPTPVPYIHPQATPYQVPSLANTPNQTPTAVPHPTPQATPYQVPSLVNTPNQTPTPVPHPTPQATPYQVPSLVNAPNQTPTAVPHPTPQATPYQVPSLVNTPNQTPTAVPHPTPQATPPLVPSYAPSSKTPLPSVLVVGQPLVSPGSSTSKATHLLTSQPVKQDTLVAVYHSNDMELKPFSSTHNHNYEGFHFTVAGINVPESNYQFISRPVAEPGTFVFYFDFASSTVHEDQWPVYDEIVEKYHHRKTPIIIIGETDGFGSKDYNTALAHHRSSIIIKELKDRGIKDSEIELRLKVRCCKSQAVTREALMATQNDRITWVHFD